jgi:hypothetical protein
MYFFIQPTNSVQKDERNNLYDSFGLDLTYFIKN